MKRVKIADLKARLSEHLRYVRRGHEVTVLDRDTPIAKLVPLQAETQLRVREPRAQYRSLKSVPLPPPLKLDTDIVELLLQERQGDR